MDYRETQAFLLGAKTMLEWVDNSMEQSSGGASRQFDINIYQIRQMLEFLEKGKSTIYN